MTMIATPTQLESKTLTLPPLQPIPDDIDEFIPQLLIHTPPPPGVEDWLLELIKSSGHLSTTEHMRWRVICLVWLVTHFDNEAAWPYLNWLNMNEPTLSDHVSEILHEAVDDMNCHVQLATWLVDGPPKAQEFFAPYRHIPGYNHLEETFEALILSGQDRTLATEVWLTAFCRDVTETPATYLHPWHLLAAVWLTICFQPETGLANLKQFCEGQPTLPPAKSKLLLDHLHKISGLPAMLQWLADCPNAEIKTILQEIVHPNLVALANEQLQSEPDYSELMRTDAHIALKTFKIAHTQLQEAGIASEKAHLLNLACGPLVPHTLLFHSAGYHITGVDLDIPPAYLPLAGFMQRFKRKAHTKAWKEATHDYYQTLARESDLTLQWRNLDIRLNDLTRLDLPDETYDVLLCFNHLQHAPNVKGVLAEAARVLKPGGVFLADIVPFTSLGGGFQTEEVFPWAHLRQPTKTPSPSRPLNRWRETDYQAALETHFNVELWQTTQDNLAEATLTPAISAELSAYSTEELTRKHLVVLARKTNLG